MGGRYSVVGALTYLKFGDGGGSFAGEDADPPCRQVVNPGAERNLTVDDGDANVAVDDDLKGVLARGVRSQGRSSSMSKGGTSPETCHCASPVMVRGQRSKTSRPRLGSNRST